MHNFVDPYSNYMYCYVVRKSHVSEFQVDAAAFVPRSGNQEGAKRMGTRGLHFSSGSPHISCEPIAVVCVRALIGFSANATSIGHILISPPPTIAQEYLIDTEFFTKQENSR